MKLTEADLMRMVRVDPITGCWIWRGRFADGVPMVQLGRGKARSARRVAWEMHRGPIPAGRFPSVDECDDRRCICPDHAKLCTRGGYMKLARARGTVIHDAVWRARVTAAKRARSPLAPEQVQEIRIRGTAGESQSSRARAFGVSQTTIYHIDHGKHWAEPAGALALMAQQAGMLP